MNNEEAVAAEVEKEVEEKFIEEDESLRDEGENEDDDDELLEFHWNGGEDDDDECDHDHDFQLDVARTVVQVAMVSANEMEHLSMLNSKCRDELYEIIFKEDISKDKVKEKMKAIQEFIAAAEHRTNELTSRVERLLKKESCTCTK
jgi:hypothetical protein